MCLHMYIYQRVWGKQIVFSVAQSVSRKSWLKLPKQNRIFQDQRLL